MLFLIFVLIGIFVAYIIPFGFVASKCIDRHYKKKDIKEGRVPQEKKIPKERTLQEKLFNSSYKNRDWL